jgi:thiol:disulfide interchange protein DsbG
MNVEQGMPVMQRRRVMALLALSAAGGGLLSACSRSDDSASGAAPAGLSPDEGLLAVAKQGKGFVVGAAEGAPLAYVLFDPQCPHCGHLWQAAEPLLGQLRMVWLPVAFIGPKSKPQGAALLSATDPRAAMSQHEASLRAGQGGLAADGAVPPELDAAIDANTELLGRLGADSVPFVIAQGPSGAAQTHAGAMDTATLANWMGVQV